MSSLLDSRNPVVPSALLRLLADNVPALIAYYAIDGLRCEFANAAYAKTYSSDTTFIRDVPGDADDVAITLAIISLATSLGLKVVAEGVETQTQLTFLEDNHCDYIQGFLVSQPLDPEAMQVWLNRHRL